MTDYCISDAKPTTRWPLRTPLAVIPAIGSYLKDKSICDIGCGSGDLLAEIIRLGYSSNVVGIELVQSKIPSERKYIICNDALKMTIPVCDVYMMWMNSNLYSLIATLPSNSIVIDMTSLPSNEQVALFQDNATLVERITYDYDETHFGIDVSFSKHLWPVAGTRFAYVYKKH